MVPRTAILGCAGLVCSGALLAACGGANVKVNGSQAAFKLKTQPSSWPAPNLSS